MESEELRLTMAQVLEREGQVVPEIQVVGYRLNRRGIVRRRPAMFPSM